jgi:cyclin-dependent kinase 7
MIDTGDTSHMDNASTASASDFMEHFGAESIISVQNSRIARSAFGEIALAIHGPQLRVVAIKTFFQSTYDASGSKIFSPEIVNEVTALRRLCPHEHVVTLLALYPSSTGSSLSLAFDYCPTDLALTLEWRRRSFLPLLSMSVIRTIAKDLFAALQHMHSLDVLHFDIKPANLLVSPTGQIQVCDFGLAQSTAHLSKETGETVMPRGLCTLHYRPPELLLGCQPSNASVDMYSAGLVISELLLGRPLFAGRNVLDQLTCIFSALGTPTAESWPGAMATPDYSKLHFVPVPAKHIAEFLPRATESEHLVDLLEHLVTIDPAKRLSSQQVKEHLWLQNEQSFVSRRDMVRELCPEQLEEPLLLSADSDAALRVAQSQVQALASKRRKFLSELVPILQDTFLMD